LKDFVVNITIEDTCEKTIQNNYRTKMDKPVPRKVTIWLSSGHTKYIKHCIKARLMLY